MAKKRKRRSSRGKDMTAATTGMIRGTQDMMVGMGTLMLGAGALNLMGEMLKK